MRDETQPIIKERQAEGPYDNTEELLTCPDCNSGKTIRDSSRGEIICSQCGLVLKTSLIDHGPEWRAFTKEQSDKRRRVGSPIKYSRADKGLSTIIDWRNRDATGRRLPAHRLADIYRMRKWHRRSRRHTSIQRNLTFAMAELDRLISQLTLPKTVKEVSAILYRRILDRKLVRGRSIEGIVAACIYIACRQTHIPCTIKEIANYSRINKKEIGRYYRLIIRSVNIKIPVIRPNEFIPRFAEKLQLSNRVQRQAIEILDAAREKLITSGKSPTGLAAASLYIASILEGERRTQKEITAVAKVTEVTIRNRYKELVNRLNLQIIT